ncbi:hypothetical protein [Candidatus Merdisoma sp. JLR.KK006]|jgi:acyl carrier protein|uniref:hypothetical protein n=1 Tax=Candidatus Merdisoma sp. JLR.KK006 TaxID=3112626 RepID=UPI002FF090E3
MNRKDVETQLKGIIKEKMNIELEQLKLDYMTNSLLDPEIGLVPRDLLVIFFEMQILYGIEFDEKDVIEKRFDFFSNIVDSICEKIGVENMG